MTDFWKTEIGVGDVLVYGALRGNSAVLREGVVTAISEKGVISIERPEEEFYWQRGATHRYKSNFQRPMKWVKTQLYYPDRTILISGAGQAFREEREKEWNSYWDLPVYVRGE